MANAKLIRLLDDLKKATAQGTVVWEDTADEDTFRIVLANGIIQIAQEKNTQQFMNYVVTLRNEKDKVVEILRTGNKNDPESRLVEELYAMARRSSRGGEALLDRMLAEIESPGLR